MIVKSSKLKVKSYSLKFKVIKFGLIIATLHFALCALHLKQASAQTLSLSIWPPLLEVMIQPGRSVTHVYKLTNNSDRELQITPLIFSFKSQGENGEIRIKYPSPPSPSKKQTAATTPPVPKFFSFGSGEKFNESFYLPIGQTREMILRISIPKDTPENDYYYTMLFSSASFANERISSSALSVTQIGTNILLSVSRNGKPGFLGRILEFSTTKIIDSFSPVNFTLRLENWGKAFWKPFGKITVSGILKQKEEISLLEQNILAESTRRLTIPAIKPKLPLGPFKARVDFSLNEDPTNKLSAETVFWYLPYKTAAIIFLFSAIIFLLKRLKRMIKQSKLAS